MDESAELVTITINLTSLTVLIVGSENHTESPVCFRVPVQTTTISSLPPYDTATTPAVGLQRLKGHQIQQQSKIIMWWFF